MMLSEKVHTMIHMCNWTFNSRVKFHCDSRKIKIVKERWNARLPKWFSRHPLCKGAFVIVTLIKMFQDSLSWSQPCRRVLCCWHRVFSVTSNDVASFYNGNRTYIHALRHPQSQMPLTSLVPLVHSVYVRRYILRQGKWMYVAFKAFPWAVNPCKTGSDRSTYNFTLRARSFIPFSHDKTFKFR